MNGFRKANTQEANQNSLAWHNMTGEDILQKLETSIDGLDATQIAERQDIYGSNTLPTHKPPPLWKIIYHQFASPLIYILLIAGIVAIIMGDVKDAVFIFIIIVFNAIIGAYQEWRAEKQAHALQALLKIQATVKRSGQQQMIPGEELVPGDVVLLESGNKVPADLRLITSNNLTIDEAFLTGEAIAAEKDESILSVETPVSDRTNMAFAGATVLTGRSLGVVVATGLQTEVGQIASSITTTKSAKPPLIIRMEKFARQISIIVLVFTILLGSFMFYKGSDLMHVLMLMIALAVATIPEGLPVAMTVALSIATSRMAKRKVIVRKLMAVESLGSCTIIASDKTGTLTVNQQTIKQVLLPDNAVISITGQGYNDEGEIKDADGEYLDDQLRNRINEISRLGILCNEASLTKDRQLWQYSGDAMDVAFWSLAYKMGFDPASERVRYPIQSAIHFESEKRYSAVAFEMPTGMQIAVKGAVEALLPFCSHMKTQDGDELLETENILLQAQELAQAGYRVLAVATTEIPSPGDSFKLTEDHLSNLTLLGLLGFIDPLRSEVKQAVDDAHEAGVKVIMITGDHPATALAIARQLDIADSADQVMTGQALEEIFGAPEFYEHLKSTRVFARVTPLQKLHIVDGLVKLGEYVAVTGDGVNDAPALRRANIGIAMGSGTDIAKDTAMITVTDDNFASIVAGIEEGRYAYSNVRKVTLFLITAGAAELILIGGAVLLGLPIPMLAIHLLWLNLVTNGIQDVALAFEAGEKGVMKLAPRRPTEGIFNRKMIEQVLLSGITMGLTCLVAWVYLLLNNMDTDSQLTEDEKLAFLRNELLVFFVLMQFYHVFNSRSEHLSAFKVPIRNNPFLMVGMLIAFTLNILATELPFLQSLLSTSPLPLERWLLLGSIASVVIIVMEIYKWIRQKKESPAQ